MKNIQRTRKIHAKFLKVTNEKYFKLTLVTFQAIDFGDSFVDYDLVVGTIKYQSINDQRVKYYQWQTKTCDLGSMLHSDKTHMNIFDNVGLQDDFYSEILKAQDKYKKCSK